MSRSMSSSRRSSCWYSLSSFSLASLSSSCYFSRMVSFFSEPSKMPVSPLFLRARIASIAYSSRLLSRAPISSASLKSSLMSGPFSSSPLMTYLIIWSNGLASEAAEDLEVDWTLLRYKPRMKSSKVVCSSMESISTSLKLAVDLSSI